MIHNMIKNKIKPSVSRLLWQSGLLAGLSIVAAYMILTFNNATWLLSLGLLAMLVAVTLLNLFPAASWIALVVSSGVVFQVNSTVLASREDFYISTALALTAFWFAHYLSRGIARQADVFSDVLDKEKKIIDEFVAYDPKTGIMRWQFAQKNLEVEVARSHRLNLPLSLLLVSVPNQTDLSDEEYNQLKGLVAELSLKNCRSDVDIPFIGERSGAILPEINIEEAQVIAWQIVEDIEQVLNVNITIGVSSLSSQANDSESLLRSAESALLFGIEWGQAVAIEEHLDLFNPLVAKPKVDHDISLDMIFKSFDEQVLTDLTGSQKINAKEWILWISGIKDDQMVDWTRERFQSSNTVQFLLNHGEHMIVKLSTGCEDAVEFANAFTSWQVKDIDPIKHYALLWPV